MRSRDSKLAHRFCVAALLLLVACWAALCAVDVNSLPKPTGYVSDLAHVVSPSGKEQLEEFCTQVEQQLGVQFALVTIDSIGDRPIEDFAIRLARKWGVGDRKSNQGVLLLIAVKDHKDDIETGRGIEPYLTDGFSGSILRSIRPELRGSDYDGALLTAARAMAQQIAQGKGIAFSDNSLPVEPPRRVPSRHRTGIPGPLFILGIFFLLWLFGRLGRGGRGGGGGAGSFLTGMLLGNLLGGGRGYGGGWSDGGGFGGDSGGGGGFGGFGGGDFGGGGANSDW